MRWSTDWSHSHLLLFYTSLPCSTCLVTLAPPPSVLPSLTWDTFSSCESSLLIPSLRPTGGLFKSLLTFFFSEPFPSSVFVIMSSKLWTEEQFNCPVCLDLPNDPVTIPCGHSYCMGCIKDFWSKDDPKGIYSCPQCRQTFCPKPPLSRNTMLAEAVEQLRKGALKSDVRDSIRSARGASSSSSRSRAKLPSSAVSCDMCKGEQRAAVKSCLVCMSSYCEAHLKPHQTKKSLKQHELIAPTGNLAEKICTQHKYLQEFFCRQCKMFVCWLCTSNYHKDHECVSNRAERLERQVRRVSLRKVSMFSVECVTRSQAEDIPNNIPVRSRSSSLSQHRLFLLDC